MPMRLVKYICDGIPKDDKLIWISGNLLERSWETGNGDLMKEVIGQQCP